MSASLCPRCQSPLSGPAADEYCPRCAGRLLLGTAAASDTEAVPQVSATSSRLGEYELGPELGRGAMGVVYRARQPRLRREVAVKVILASRFVGESARKRFLAEAELAAQLDHPNIVPIYEVGETEDGPFYAMKLIAGGTLAERIACEEVGKWESGRTASLLAKLARAVHHAHERGVLHRDLKPGNILLDANGEPHITDFGLARQLGADSSLTLTGATLGTPAYMSPEQAAGERGITTASDVWSLGAILFHLLTGRPPFLGTTATDVLLQVRTDEPPRLRSLDSTIPADLETICLKCLEKEPGRRYATAAELADDLDHFLRHEPIRARRARVPERVILWTRRHPARAAVAVAFLVLLLSGAGGVLWQWHRAETNAEQNRQRLVRMATATAIHRVEENDLSTALPWFVEAMRLDIGTHDRKSRAANSDAAWSHRVRITTTLRQSPRLAQVWFHDAGVRYASFSSDGKRVAAASDDGTGRVWDTLTGDAATPPLRHAKSVRQVVFSSDNSRVMTASDDGTARVWNARTGEPLTRPLVNGNEWLKVDFSPDGERVISAGQFADAQLWNTKTGDPVGPPLHHENGPISSVTFSRDGRLALTSGHDRTARLWNARTGEPVGLPLSHDGPVLFAAFSPDGKHIVTAGEPNHARIWEVASQRVLIPFLRHAARVEHAEFSADSTRVLTASLDGTARVWDVATGQPVTPPLQHTEPVHHAALSPDGRWVVTASQDHTAQVWDVARGGRAFPPLWHGHAVEHAVFSPDGRRVLTASLDGVARLWELSGETAAPALLAGDGRLANAVFDADRRRVSTISDDNTARVWDAATGAAISPVLALDSPGQCAVLSPDGSRLATGSQGAAQVWDVATGKLISQVRHERPIRFIVWRPDGHAVLSVADDDDTARVWNPDMGADVTPPLAHGEEITDATFSPDGKRIATVSNSGTGRVWNAATGQSILAPLRHGGGLRRVRFNRDGTLLVTASMDGTVRLWNPASGAQVTPPLRHGGWVNDLAFSPDGRRILTTSDDGTARLWDTTAGQPVTTPLRLGGGVWAPCFSRDGRVVLAGNGLFAQVWEADTGLPLTPLLKSQTPVIQIAFSPDEQHVLGVTVDRRLVSFDLRPLDWPLEDFAAAARLLSCRELDATGALVPLAQSLEGGRTELSAGSSDAVALPTTNTIAHAPLDGPTLARALLRSDWERLRTRLNPVGSQRGESPAGNTEIKEPKTERAFHVIDLTRHYNFSLTNSLHETPQDNSFSALTPGVHQLGEVDFSIHGLVHLAGEPPATRSFPERVQDIAVNRQARELHFLHACGWSAEPGTVIAGFIVHYANGAQVEIPVTYGRDVRDWHTQSGASADAVWTGTNAESSSGGRRIQLFKTTWTNPHPEVEIVSLDYVSKMTGAAPFLLALTAEP